MLISSLGNQRVVLSILVLESHGHRSENIRTLIVYHSHQKTSEGKKNVLKIQQKLEGFSYILQDSTQIEAIRLARVHLLKVLLFTIKELLLYKDKMGCRHIIRHYTRHTIIM